jgi:hypothetical protein
VFGASATSRLARVLVEREVGTNEAVHVVTFVG